MVRSPSKVQYSDLVSIAQKDRCWSEFHPTAGVLGTAMKEAKLEKLDCAYP